ncbi:hypothetical protein AHAS_Ahas15G0212500 [Arachis hypogaea]
MPLDESKISTWMVLMLAVALSSILKILKLEVFDERTPSAMEAIVTAITSCRLEKTDPMSEDAVMMKILQVLAGTMHHRASILLSDFAVCTLVNTCFQVVQQMNEIAFGLELNGHKFLWRFLEVGRLMWKRRGIPNRHAREPRKKTPPLRCASLPTCLEALSRIRSEARERDAKGEGTALCHRVQSRPHREATTANPFLSIETTRLSCCAATVAVGFVRKVSLNGSRRTQRLPPRVSLPEEKETSPLILWPLEPSPGQPLLGLASSS